jgi:mannose-1-phosphate guanylyltransferase/mannose-6-phosphate isomerase
MAADALPFYAVLLAGGVGSRLWPVSRELYPKQLVKFIGKDSLVQATAKRLLPLLEPDKIRVVCGSEHRHAIARHLKAIGIAPEGKIICEPCGRNTAPAILLGVLHILRSESDAVVGVFPADHFIRDTAVFHRRLQTAVTLAQAGHVVTFGITPRYPETGYGYIEGGAETPEGARMTRRFVEKPDLDTARHYVDAGCYYWNSGMFAFRAGVILEEFQRYQPEMLSRMRQLDLGGDAIPAADYARLADISIDYAIMEKTRKGLVLPSDFGWSDIGSWKSLYEFLPKDEHNNVIDGDVIARDTRNSMVMSYERLIAVNHINGLVVVETPDSIFVSDLENSRDVKSIVDGLKQRGRREYRQHRTVAHPWGSITLLEQTSRYRIDRLIINPDMHYSADSGNDAGRHVSIISGQAAIVDADGRRDAGAGQSYSASAGAAFQIENCGDDALRLLIVEIEP